jgi:hypothetical protein
MTPRYFAYYVSSRFRVWGFRVQDAGLEVRA